jgi:CheY-like chemotaxis protein
MRPLNVLVVEDDLELRMFYQLALMEQGHAVNAVANGAEALDAVSPAIDLIVTDLGMPIMAGDELIAELRAKPEFRDLPVLVITAHPGSFAPSSGTGGRACCESHSSSMTSCAGWTPPRRNE